MFMQIVLHLFIASAGFVILGGTLASFIIRFPTINPLWAVVTTVFIFAPAAILGGIFVNFAINR